MIKLQTAINTPCVGICSTVYGDEVCRGCKRFYREIIEWNALTEVTKQAVFKRLSDLMSRTVANFLVVHQPDLLLQELQRLHIRYHRSDDMLCWAHHLLRAVQDKPCKLEDCGIKVHDAYAGLSVNELFTKIDNTLYQVTNEFYQQQTATQLIAE